MILQSDIDGLRTTSNSEFEIEAQQLIGRDAYRTLLRSGMNRTEITAEILRMAAEACSPPERQVDLFKDQVAQCNT